MSTLSRSQLCRCAIPVCLLVMAVALSLLLRTPEECRESPFPSPAISESIDVEARLQAKAEKVLRGFGESEPIAVVTAEVRTGYTEVRHNKPNHTGVVESEQKTSEAMERGPCGSDCAENTNEYLNEKVARNWVIGSEETFHKTFQPTVMKVTCLVQVSEENRDRMADIQNAVEVALGLDLKRGDVALAVAK
jgi:Flagellar M-ring protein C-terminal